MRGEKSATTPYSISGENFEKELERLANKIQIEKFKCQMRPFLAPPSLPLLKEGEGGFLASHLRGD